MSDEKESYFKGEANLRSIKILCALYQDCEEKIYPISVDRKAVKAKHFARLFRSSHLAGSENKYL